jgi:hypothetical protein
LTLSHGGLGFAEDVKIDDVNKRIQLQKTRTTRKKNLNRREHGAAFSRNPRKSLTTDDTDGRAHPVSVIRAIREIRGFPNSLNSRVENLRDAKRN